MGCVFLFGCTSTKNYLSNTWLKAEIDTCKETIRKIPKPDLAILECNDRSKSCQDMLKEMAPSIDCTYEIGPCRQAAREKMVIDYKAKIPERCHEIKKQYPGVL